MQTTTRTPLWWLAGIGSGALAGFIDLHAAEVQAPAAFVLLAAGTLGFLHPRHAWQWALLVGMGIPAAHWLIDALGMTQPYAVTPWYSMVVLPLVFALVAAYMGAGLRNIIRASAV
jgi:hypothetical protein